MQSDRTEGREPRDWNQNKATVEDRSIENQETQIRAKWWKDEVRPGGQVANKGRNRKPSQRTADGKQIG